MDNQLFQERKFFRRKHYFIQKPFQFKFALVVFCAMATIGLGALFGIYLFNWKLISYFFIQRGIYVNLYEVFQRANLLLLKQMAILCLIIAAASIFVSHKIAGPAYRLEHNIRSLIKGDLTLRSKVRKSDELESLAEAVETLAESLNNEIKNNRKLLQKISSSLPETGLDEVKSLIEELKKANSKYQLRE